MSVNVNQKFSTWLEWQNFYEVHEGAVESRDYVRRRSTKKECFKTSTEDGDDWMSDGNELRRSDDAATGNVRRPTAVSRNGGTSS